MKLTVLMDNNTLIDRYFVGEPAASYLIEHDGRKTLFDVGYSGAFIENAHKLSVSLLHLDYVVLSHGHSDHTWGLDPLVRLYTEGRMEGLAVGHPTVVAHPHVFVPRTCGDVPDAGSMLSESYLSRVFRLSMTRSPFRLSERLLFLGEIERTNEFEARRPMGRMVVGGMEQDDYLMDDSALVYQAPSGLVIITGCSHAGICNIVEYAIKLTGDDRVLDIIGGLHLLNPPSEQLRGTVAYLGALHAGAVHACHCTDLESKIALSTAVNLKEVGVGMTFEF